MKVSNFTRSISQQWHKYSLSLSFWLLHNCSYLTISNWGEEAKPIPINSFFCVLHFSASTLKPPKLIYITNHSTYIYPSPLQLFANQYNPPLFLSQLELVHAYEYGFERNQSCHSLALCIGSSLLCSPLLLVLLRKQRSLAWKWMQLIIARDGTLIGKGIDNNLSHVQRFILGRWPITLEGASHNM